MPDAFEFPRVLRPVVPLVRSKWFTVRRFGVIGELIALAHRHAFWSFSFLARWCARLEPGFSTVVGALNDLAKPAACLRRVDAVRIDRRSFEVVHFPAAKMGTSNVPLFSGTVGDKDEGAFFRAN